MFVFVSCDDTIKLTCISRIGIPKRSVQLASLDLACALHLEINGTNEDSNNIAMIIVAMIILITMIIIMTIIIIVIIILIKINIIIYYRNNIPEICSCLDGIAFAFRLIRLAIFENV